MTKVIKGEFEKLESLKISDVSLTCNTSLEIFNEEFNRMSRKWKTTCLHMRLKLLRGDDEVVLTDEESSNSDDEDEDAKIFWIETNVFDFETPLCRLTKNISTIGYMSEIKMCHGCMKDYGWRMEYGRNQLQLNIIISHLIIKVGIQSGLLVAGENMDIVMDETCLELT
ncbi:hypothetical protein Tco_1141187 [Tanacetum coccineum]